MNLTDHFLVAMPGLCDQMFGGSVVYIASHDTNDGSVGVIINKPLNRKVGTTFKGSDFVATNPMWSDGLLYLGGPLNVDNGFILHRNNLISAQNGLFSLSADGAILNTLSLNNADKNLFVTVGYSAWMDLQLEEEIAQNDWLVVKANPDLMYEVEPQFRYQEALKMLGINNISKLDTDEPGFA